MAGLTDYTERKLLDHLFGTAWTVPSTLYIGVLGGTLSDDAGGGLTEQTIGVGGYARVATTAADWGAATGTAPATKSNISTKTFPTATADWLGGANVTYLGLYDDNEGGNLLAVYALPAGGKPVLAGDTPSIGAGDMVTKLGDPSDPYS